MLAITGDPQPGWEYTLVVAILATAVGVVAGSGELAETGVQSQPLAGGIGIGLAFLVLGGVAAAVKHRHRVSREH